VIIEIERETIMPEKITIVHELELTDDFLSGVMCTALEGGIGYWAIAKDIKRTEGDDWEYLSCELADNEEYHDAEIDQQEILDELVEEEEHIYEDYEDKLRKMTEAAVKWNTLNYEVIAKGCKRAIEGNYGFAKYILEQDGGMIDAGDADCIVQLGVLGEVVYG
jgi:hypothetical protein